MLKRRLLGVCTPSRGKEMAYGQSSSLEGRQLTCQGSLFDAWLCTGEVGCDRRETRIQ